MGDQNTIIDEADLRQILARTGFGPGVTDMRRAKKLIGRTRGEAADHVLSATRKIIKAKGTDLTEIHNSWVKHLTKGKNQLLDKAVLFFHDHFSVTASVLDELLPAVIQHLQLHYEHALADFKVYCKAINKNPAMMVFLDTVKNKKAIPNENYARELCELFTLGVTDLNGAPNYEQDDIVQIARAFTGWRADEETGLAFLNTGQHDYVANYPMRGPKVLFENAHGFPPGGASFTTGGEGENEIDEVIDILFAHTDSDGQNTVARRITKRLIEFFAYANPDKTIVDEVISNSSFDSTWNIEQLIRAIIVHDVFYETMAPAPFLASTKKSVKWPIDFMIGTLRMLKMKPRGKALELPGGKFRTMEEHGANMGQVIGEPPSVFGWELEQGWISSTTLLARYEFARDIVNARTSGRFRPERFVGKNLTDPGEIADAVTDALNVTTQFTDAERTELIDYLTDGGLNPSLDLKDDDVRNTKLHGAFSLVMESAAFQLH